MSFFKKMSFTIVLYGVFAILCGMVGLVFGWLVGKFSPFVLCGVAAGIVGVAARDHWPRLFNEYLSFWWCSFVMIVACVMLGGNIGAATGWHILGLTLGALFGVLIATVSLVFYFLRRNVQ